MEKHIPKIQKQFLEAYDLFADDLFRYCYFKISDREGALDMVQDVFMKAWQYLEKGNVIDQFRPFLYRLAHNLVIDLYRKKSGNKTPVSLDTMNEAGFDPVDSKADATIHAQIEEAMALLDRLSEEDRELIVFRYVSDVSPKEIALLWQETENNISVKIHRAIKRFRELLQ